jgi:hypothetical protein
MADRDNRKRIPREKCSLVENIVDGVRLTKLNRRRRWPPGAIRRMSAAEMRVHRSGFVLYNEMLEVLVTWDVIPG